MNSNIKEEILQRSQSYVNSQKINDDWCLAIKTSIANYNKYGPRSSKKVDIIHMQIKLDLQFMLGSDYDIKLEDKVPTYGGGTKRVDLSVKSLREQKFVGIISVKFPMSSIPKNESNYSEILIGESYIIKKCYDDIKFMSVKVGLSSAYDLKNGVYIRKGQDQSRYLNTCDFCDNIDFGALIYWDTDDIDDKVNKTDDVQLYDNVKVSKLRLNLDLYKLCILCFVNGILE